MNRVELAAFATLIGLWWWKVTGHPCGTTQEVLMAAAVLALLLTRWPHGGIIK